jgi:hypothetical protein
MAQDLIEDAKTSVSKFGAKANLFIALADYILSRKS